MAYLLKVPRMMRIFTPVTPGSKLLRRTDSVFSPGEFFRLSEITVASYDHRDKLVLKSEEGTLYLLVEEIDEEIRELAFVWTSLYEESHNAGAALATIRDYLVPLLRRYIQREIQVVVDPDFGVYFV
ncbi:MAG: hypothetical protein Q8L52_00755 [bacterium]|nr:hypothetical protein [bacterium]